MKIQSAAVLGAGAVGAYLINALMDKPGVSLCVIAKDERKKRLQEQGIFVNGRQLFPVIKAPDETAAPDVLFVTLKYQNLRGALEDIRQAVGADTIVVSLMNGIDSEEIIAEVIGMEHIVHSMVRISSTRVGNEIRYQNPEGHGGVYIGVPGKAPSEDERIAALEELFSGTPVVLHKSEDILRDMWDKLALNISRNLPQALIDVGAGAYEDSVYLKDAENKLRKEAAAVAAAKGIIIPEENRSIPYEPNQKYSTLQDLLAKRHTEIDMFCGALSRQGKALGVPTPYTDFMYDFIKALEEKNDGRFDY